MKTIDISVLEKEVATIISTAVQGNVRVEVFPDDPANYLLTVPTALLVHWRGDEVQSTVWGSLETVTDIFDITVVSKRLHCSPGNSTDGIHGIINPLRDSLRGVKLSNGAVLSYSGTRFVKHNRGEWHYLVTFKSKTGLG